MIRLKSTHETVMALQLRPNCEYCDKDLPPNALDARICSYECTFCADCAENKLHNVCPNCGGGFVPRPIRPATRMAARRIASTKQPPSDKRVHLKYSLEDIAAHCASIGIFRRSSGEPPPSLRAKRSNPDFLRRRLDCSSLRSRNATGESLRRQ